MLDKLCLKRCSSLGLSINRPAGTTIKMPTLNSRTISRSIEALPARVYEFVSSEANLPLWATAFIKSIRPRGDEWLAETPFGEVGIRFVPQNSMGVLDHHVRLPSGETVFQTMRVIANGTGCEVLFTLFQLPEMSDALFQTDIGLVERDLATLQGVLESSG